MLPLMHFNSTYSKTHCFSKLDFRYLGEKNLEVSPGQVSSVPGKFSPLWSIPREAGKLS